MSWSIGIVGKPENVIAEIEAESVRLSGNSKTEFDAAKPHLIGIVQQNFGNHSQVVELEASGHGTVDAYRNLSVHLKPNYFKFV